MKPKYLVTLLAVSLLSGCEFAGTSLFPLRLAYIEETVDIDSLLQGPIEDIRMSVLFNAQSEYLLVLDQPPSAEKRLLVFDEDLELVFGGTASEEGVAGEFGPLMMIAEDLSFVVGNVTIAPDGSFALLGALNAADDRVGFSNFVDTNWIVDVTDDSVNFRLRINEYDTTWALGPTGQYNLDLYDPNTTVTIEDVLYLDDTQEIILAIHYYPANEMVLFSFDRADFPASLTVPTNSWIEDGIYVEPLPNSIDDVMRDSVFFTVDGFVFYDLREKRLKRVVGDESNLRIETEGSKPRFAFSLLGDTYYYVDPERGDLYKMGTWW